MARCLGTDDSPGGPASALYRLPAPVRRGNPCRCLRVKLFLHWLCWDLRRFRVPLLIWVGSVALFIGWLIWLHLNQLTLPARLPEANEPIGAILGILEFFLVLYILTTDPAEGTRPFWKT